MARIRVIPVLLIREGGLVKPIRFKEETYVGDPINAVKIFNEKEVDELIFVDISASEEKRPPQFKTIADVAGECFMPLCYGGGITTIDEMKRLFETGVEKVCINSAAHKNPSLVSEAAAAFGSQSIVVSIDVKKDILGRYRVYTDRGKTNTDHDPATYAKQMEDLGAGEILLTSIDRDGTLEGYDCKLIDHVSKHLTIQLVACGGGRSVDDFAKALHAGASAVAAGTLFMFHGPHRAVLINFPTASELQSKLGSG